MALTTTPFLLTWPRMLMRDRMWQWELTARTITGGKTFSGAVPMARLDGGGLWTCTLQDVQVSTPDHIRAWRALSALLDNGATPVILEARDERAGPWPATGSAGLTATNDDGSTPGDGSVYASDVIAAALTADAALRATRLQISIENAAALAGGEFFSILHDTFSHRLYRIGAVEQSGTTATVTIRPPLREATAAGTPLDFDHPRCVMQLATPDAMDLMLTRRTFGQATPRFIERLPPFSDADVIA